MTDLTALVAIRAPLKGPLRAGFEIRGVLLGKAPWAHGPLRGPLKGPLRVRFEIRGVLLGKGPWALLG